MLRSHPRTGGYASSRTVAEHRSCCGRIHPPDPGAPENTICIRIRKRARAASTAQLAPDDASSTSYAYAHDLTPELKDKIEEAFFSFDFEGTALGEEFTGVSEFIPITYKDQWNVIRQIQKANGVEYTSQGLAAE